MLNTLLAVASGTLDRTVAALVYLGLAVTVVAALLHWRCEGTDPFRRAQVRGSRITPVMVLLPLMGHLLAATLFDALRRQLGGSAATKAAELTANSLAQMVGAGCCLWVASRCFRGGVPGFLLGRRGAIRSLGMALVYLLAAGGLCELVAQVTQRLFLLFDPAYPFAEHRVIEALRDSAEPRWASAVLWIGAAVVAPVAEECFFRGMIQTMLLRALRKRWAAVLVPAVLFGLAHANQPHVVPALILFGVILGFQYERSGGLIGPIALHALFNLKTLVWQWLMGPAGG